MKTNKFILLIIIFFSGVLLGSCSLADSPEGNIPITLKFPTRAVDFDYDGDDIVSLRLIVFRAGQEKCIMNSIIYAAAGDYDFDLDVDPGNQVFGKKQLELPQGIYDFFLMANESEGVAIEDYGPKLEAVETRSDLADIKISNIDLGGSSEVGGYPSGKIILEKDIVPFPRSTYMRNVYVGNNVTNAPNDQVSIDGGRTWQSELPLDLKRISAKFNIGIRKLTGIAENTHEKDAFYITDIRVLHVPSFAYMISKVYDSDLYNTLVWYKWDGGDREPNDFFTVNNTGSFVYIPEGGEPQNYSMSNRADVIIPEYILQDPASTNLAIILEIRGDYYHYSEGQSTEGDLSTYAQYGDVEWIMPLNFGTEAQPDYQTKANKAYDILVTITQPAKFTFTPRVTILVSGWDQDNDGYYNAGNGNVSVSGSWSKGSPDVSDRLYVNADDYVEYTFRFEREDAGDRSIIHWKAVLTNPVDFQLLTTGGAATQGYARAGDTYKVRVSPRAVSNQENITKLYINIDDGAGGTIRLPLNAQDSYSIHQNPR